MTFSLVNAPAAGSPTRDAVYQKIMQQLHGELVESLDPLSIKNIPRPELEQQLRRRLGETVRSRNLPLTQAQQDDLSDDILDEILGHGPLERLLRMPDVTDILVNGPESIFVERGGRLELSDVRFRDERHLLHVIDRIVSRVGRRIDESVPMVDARLSDGSRFNAIIAPLALKGPVVSIRRFGVKPIHGSDLVRFGAMPQVILDMLEGCVKAKLNILIAGGTGSGKTTMLNVLSSFIPEHERIVTIEDAAELQLQQIHVVPLETRPPNLEGMGEVSIRDLVRNSLRMRPDRIIVGEIRGAEAIDMLQAMNTGHEGSLSTIHANNPRHALARLEMMVGMAMGNLPGPAIREIIVQAIHLVIQANRLSDGKRRITSITEITGMESGIISTQEVYRFRQRTVDAEGKVRGVMEATGLRPNFASRLASIGIEIPAETLNCHIEV